MRTSIVQETVLLTRAYYALLCLTRAPAQRPSQQQLRDTQRALAALSLHHPTRALPATLPCTALAVVLQQGACPALQAGPWVTAALHHVRNISREAWPLQDRSGSTALLEALLFSGQSLAALHYIRQVGFCSVPLSFFV